MRLNSLLKFVPLLIFCSASAVAPAYKGDVIIGDWMDSKKETLVRCYKKDGKYYGKILWVENLANKGKPLPPSEQFWINTVAMKDFVYEDGEWADGTIYQPKTDATYTAYIKLIDNNHMEVVGYIWFRIFSESEKFSRVNNL